jgi:hypothetical protein
MAKGYSKDLRERAVAMVEEGESRRDQVVELFQGDAEGQSEAEDRARPGAINEAMRRTEAARTQEAERAAAATANRQRASDEAFRQDMEAAGGAP